MKLCGIHLRDPFILPDNGVYYLYGTRGATCWGAADGFDVYTSTDLKQWEGSFPAFTRPADFWADRNFWAPEVHLWQGRYYMLASFKSKNQCRGTQILAADTPMGPFFPHSEGPVTPRDWECLDGTLYIEENRPYMVFCHEWLQVQDGGHGMLFHSFDHRLYFTCHQPNNNPLERPRLMEVLEKDNALTIK